MRRLGGSGKVNALASGFQGVATPWALLTDADTRHQPELLARAHAAAAEHRLDALSLSGRQLTAGLGESLLTPAAYALLDRMLGTWALKRLGFRETTLMIIGTVSAGVRYLSDRVKSSSVKP